MAPHNAAAFTNPISIPKNPHFEQFICTSRPDSLVRDNPRTLWSPNRQCEISLHRVLQMEA